MYRSLRADEKTGSGARSLRIGPGTHVSIAIVAQAIGLDAGVPDGISGGKRSDWTHGKSRRVERRVQAGRPALWLRHGHADARAVEGESTA
jgi:hypothetical protein